MTTTPVTRRYLLPVAIAVLMLGLARVDVVAQTGIVTLTAYTSGAFRWKDAAGNVYAPAYQASYSYTQATVVIRYATNSVILTGTMTASGLKPNFAYQFKLIGHPETHPNANEKLGFSGRWWKEEWDGVQWANGWNLNDKRPGTFPNSNDVWYAVHKDDPAPTSPTGRKYRLTGYRPFDYFITDDNGDAVLDFTMTASYHVLWSVSQRVRGPDDGPARVRLFDPDPASPAYAMDYPASSAGIFGEWERLPSGRIYIAPGNYTLEFLLTEESFHGSGLDGWWAHAAHGPAEFTIVSPVILATARPPYGGRIEPSGELTLPCGADTNVVIVPAPYWTVEGVSVDGEARGPTNAWAFRNVTNHHAITARFAPLLATNGVPRWWLSARNAAWTNDFDGAATNDADGDGMLTWEEYLAGTDPTDDSSRFRIFAANVGGTNVLRWMSPYSDPSLPGFGVQRSVGLTGGWDLVESGVPRSPDGTNTWIDMVPPPVDRPLFYRVVATN